MNALLCERAIAGHYRRPFLPLIIGAACAGVFLLDHLVPQGMIVPVFYILPICLAAGLRQIWGLRLTVTACSALTVLGYYISAPGVAEEFVFLNRGALVVVFAALVPLIESLKGDQQKPVDVASGELQSMRLYAGLFEAAPIGLLMADETGQITHINRLAEEMFGYGHQALIGQSVETLIPAQFRDGHAGKRQGFFASPATLRMGAGRSLFGRRLDGMEFPIEVGLTPIPSQEGLQVLAAVVDITERKRAEDALRSSEASNQAVLDSLTAHVAVLDRTGVILSINAAWEQFARENKGPASIVGANYLDVCSRAGGGDADTARKAMAGIRAVLHGEQERFSIEYPCHSPGTRRWFLLIASRFSHKGGGAIVSHINITDRKLAEQALQASQEQFELAMRGTNDGMWYWNVLTGEKYWSDRFLGLLGYGSGEFTPGYDSWSAILHPDDRERVLDRLQRHLDQRTPYNVEYRIKSKSGTYRWFHAKGQAVWDESGRPVRMAGSVSDVTDRKQSEVVLKESEERLRQAVRAGNIGIFHHDHETGGIYWSPEQRRIYGWELDEPVTLTKYLDHVHPDDRARIAEAIERAHDPSGEGVFDVEHRIIDRQGAVRWLFTRSRTHFEGEGKMRRRICTIGAVSDITDRKRTEQALREAHASVELAVEGIAKLDEEGRYVSVNMQYATMTGYSPEELVGQSWEITVHPGDRESVLKTFQQMLACGKGEAEIRGLRKDGTVFHKQVVIVKPDAHLYRMSGHYCFLWDISARKRAEDALRASQERFALAVRGTNDGIWDWTIDTNENYWSDRWHELLGYQPGDLAPCYDTWASLIHPDDREMVLERARQHIQEGVPYDLEYRMRTKSGTYRWFLAKGQAVWDRAGRPLRMAGAISDVTERKQAEERLRTSEALLRATLEEQERLALDLHDGAIQSLFALGLTLREVQQLLDHDRQSAGRRLDDGLAAVNGVIRELRRSILGREAPAMTVDGWKAAVAEFIDSIRGGRGLPFDVQFESSALERLSPDEGNHVLYILRESVSNAARHSQGTKGRLVLIPDGPGVRLTVEDNGIGFDMTRAQTQGMGLRNITARAEKLGARLVIVSSPGQGLRMELAVRTDAAMWQR